MEKRSKKKKGSPEMIASRGKVAEGEEIPANKSPGVSRTTIVQAVVIAAATLWIYWPVLAGDWLWDDDVDITDNSITKSPTGLWSIWFGPGSQSDYYPIKQSLQWIQWHLWGMDTPGYHLTNVFLHILGALLVWRLLSKLGLRLAWLGGIIFAIHPVQVESVAWITELKNTLSLPPFLLAMCSWIDFDEHGKRRDYFLAVGLFLVAMLCKTTMATFPVVILLYAWWKRGRIGWNDLRVGAPFFLVSLALGILTVWCQQHSTNDLAPKIVLTPQRDIFPGLACAGLSLSLYISKFFLPVELLPIYPEWKVDPPSILQFLPWFILGGVIYWLWTKRYGWGRHALLGLGFFLISLAPILVFIMTNYTTLIWSLDHLVYIPLLGLIGLVVAAVGRMEAQLPASFRPWGIGFVTVVLALLAFQSHSYAKLFFNSETLWTYELKHNPEAYPAYNNLGGALLQKGEMTEAMEQFEEVLKIKPDFALAHNNLGKVLLQTGRLSEAMEQFEEALQIEPNNAEAHNNVGHILFQTGRLSEAIDQFNQALAINPDYAKAHNNLGSVLGQLGRLPEAVEQFEQALRIEPDYADAHYNLGIAFEQSGRVPEAMEQFQATLQIDPNFTAAQNNLTQLQALQKTAPAKN